MRVPLYMEKGSLKWRLQTFKLLRFFFQGFLIYEEEYIVMKAKLKSGGQPAIPEWDSWEVSTLTNIFQSGIVGG